MSKLNMHKNKTENTFSGPNRERTAILTFFFEDHNFDDDLSTSTIKITNIITATEATEPKQQSEFPWFSITLSLILVG